MSGPEVVELGRFLTFEVRLCGYRTSSLDAKMSWNNRSELRHCKYKYQTDVHVLFKCSPR